jgi:hypothetical protein
MRMWQGQHRDSDRRLARLIHRMKFPGGSSNAERWWPAALFCHWPPSLHSWFVSVVARESSGRLMAENPSSHCLGILQLHPMHWAKYGYEWMRDVFHQLRLGLKLYRECGSAPWAL